ncbi:MAG: hypothetical protein OXH68_15390 [Gammaproteobacteria bacterium]|nr:hypothetical protein [Gammaproteobacteria bacterium]
MAQSADSEQTRDPVDEVIAAWCSDPGDRCALAGVRAEFLARYASAIQSGAGDVGELLRAASNLIDRVGEGTVEPNEAVVAGLDAAAGRIDDPTHAMAASGVEELVERLDAYASGLTDFELGEARPSRGTVAAEPPLLTVRHDGARVKPGSFEATSPGEVPPSELPVLVDAWKAVGEHLRGQLESARSIAGTNADPELRRLSIALQGVVETVERLNRTLAAYARRVGG